MRQIASILDKREAQRFTAYLVTSGVEAQTEPDGDGWAIWVRNENDVERAKESYESFRHNPDDRRYAGAEREAEAIRRRQIKERQEAERNVVDVRRRWQQPMAKDAPLTMTLIALSILVSLGGDFGQAKKGFGGTLNQRLGFCTQRSFAATKGNPLADVGKGEVWRVVTPIFMHLEWFHLIFNMLWFFQFGALIEKLRGTWRLGLLVLFVAVLSNSAQAVAPAQWGGTCFFGGMSGVVYGLFGYIWMKAVFDARSGFVMPQLTVIILVGWLFLCMTPAVPRVANVAHVVGLVAGMAIGYLPRLWRG